MQLHQCRTDKRRLCQVNQRLLASRRSSLRLIARLGSPSWYD
jgi:hypothetical protein